MEKKSECKPKLLRKNAGLLGLGLERCRTGQALITTPGIVYQNGLPGLVYQDNFYPIVTRYTSNFSKLLCSLGTYTPKHNREVLLLDPNSALLQKHLAILSEQLSKIKKNPHDILQHVHHYVVGLLEPFDVTELVQQTISRHYPFLSIDFFLQKNRGSCRHFALLLAFFLSALGQKGALDGRVILHRQNLRGSRAGDGAHAWVLFVLEGPQQFYSIDGMFRCMIAGNNCDEIDNIYGSGTARYLAEKHKPIRDCYRHQLVPEAKQSLTELRGLLGNSLFHQAEGDSLIARIDALIEDLQAKQVALDVEEVKAWHDKIAALLQVAPKNTITSDYLSDLSDFFGTFANIEPLEPGESLYTFRVAQN